MRVNIDTLKEIKRTLDNTVSALGGTGDTLKNRKDQIKDEGWNDAQATAFESILESIARTTKQSAREMASCSRDVENLIKKVEEYQKVKFSEN